MRKKNFIPKKIKLKIDENVNEKVTAVLSRTIRFIAFDESNMSQKDIGANLVRLKRGINNYLNVSRITPFEMSLPAYSYQAVFQKPGYHNTEVNVGPADRLVQVEMEPLKAFVEIKVLDALSNQPVSEAEIYYNFINNPQPLDLFLDRTTAKGDAFGQLSAGRYTFFIKKAGYRTLNKSVVMQPGEKQTLVFKIYLSN
ncbi:MAG: carboxypeptidase-like regulatory domain-containing protein [bacterium]